jgi:hypothetical protein
LTFIREVKVFSDPVTDRVSAGIVAHNQIAGSSRTFIDILIYRSISIIKEAFKETGFKTLISD